MSVHDLDEITSRLNAAADDILEAIELPEEGARDCINLLCNVFLCYLQNTANTLEDVILINYGPPYEGETDEEMVERVLGWCSS